MSRLPAAIPLLATLLLIGAVPARGAEAPAKSLEVSAPNDADSAQRRLAVEKVLVATQIPQGARLLSKAFLDQAASDPRAKQLNAEQKRQFDKFIRLFFNAEAFEQSVRAQVAEKTAAMPVAALLEFARALDTPLVRRMQALELAALDARERKAALAYRQQLKKKLPPLARLELAGRYVKATGNAEQIARVNEVMVRRMLVAANPGMDAAAVENRLADLRPKLLESAADEAVTGALAQFRKVDDHALQRYVELLEQPAVAPLMQLVGDAVADQMDGMMGRVFQMLSLIAAGVPLDDIARRLSAPEPGTLPAAPAAKEKPASSAPMRPDPSLRI